MTLFQYIALSALGLLLTWELVTFRRRTGPRGFKWLRCAVWITAAAAIAFPEVVSLIGAEVGIGRGADLVMYLSVLAFLGVSFSFYAREVRLQRQLTEVVRHLALREARRGGESPPGGSE
jgi:hypothetical protein